MDAWGGRDGTRLTSEFTNFISLILCECNRFHNNHTALITGRRTTVTVQRPAGICFINAGMRIFRKHGIALICADAKDQRYLITARPHAGKKRLTYAICPDLNPTVCRIELNRYAGDNACAKRGSAFIFVSDAAAVRAVLRAKASGKVYSIAFA